MKPSEQFLSEVADNLGEEAALMVTPFALLVDQLVAAAQGVVDTAHINSEEAEYTDETFEREAGALDTLEAALAPFKAE